MDYNINELMKNPAFLMGANMMAANQGKGMAMAPAAGMAFGNTARQLTAMEQLSADRTYKNKMLDIQEARNTESARSNKAKEAIAGQGPEAVLDKKGKRVGTTMGGRFTNAPSMSMMDMMMMGMGGMGGMGMGGMGMGGPGGSKPVGPGDVAGSFGPQASAPGLMGANASASVVPPGQNAMQQPPALNGYGMPGMGQGPSMWGPQQAPAAPQQPGGQNPPPTIQGISEALRSGRDNADSIIKKYGPQVWQKFLEIANTETDYGN